MEGLISAALGYAGWKLKKIRETEKEIQQKEKDFEELELLNTRMNLIRECNHYIEKGFAPVYARTSITAIYEKYHALGGNGGIEGLFTDFKNLPVKEAAKK